MQLLANTTSPFVRIVRTAMLEKGLDIEPTLVDPWADDARLRAATPPRACRRWFSTTACRSPRPCSSCNGWR